jgi:lipopolysaccharide transport system ATP-binding protein
MSDIVIRAEGLGKKYTIGHNTPREPYTAMRDVIAREAQKFLRKGRDMVSGRPIIEGDELEEVWALHDVNFEISRGELVGIIGRNGAGKSTLLKILSRITDPSEGRVTIKGQVASLLEVGTGFHPELTGRENIFLNGAILGMSRAVIKRKLDEIVAFAEVEKFLDTPVKRYSSGMYVRLAFAVAAHLEPEILIVDEVLAVGDAEFQKKCLGKMGDVAMQGRTVLFVSHNMGAIQRLCKRCIVMDRGSVALDAEVGKAVSHYLRSGSADRPNSWPEVDQAPGNEIVRLRSIRFVGRDGSTCSQSDVRDPLTLEIDFHVFQPAQLAISVQVINGMDSYIMTSMDSYVEGPWGKQEPYAVGSYRTSCHIPGDLLNEGQLSINLWLYSPPSMPNESPHVRLMNAASVTIIDSYDPGGARGSFPYEWGHGPAVRPRLKWTREPLPE